MRAFSVSQTQDHDDWPPNTTDSDIITASRAPAVWHPRIHEGRIAAATPAFSGPAPGLAQPGIWEPATATLAR